MRMSVPGADLENIFFLPKASYMKTKAASVYVFFPPKVQLLNRSKEFPKAYRVYCKTG